MPDEPNAKFTINEINDIHAKTLQKTSGLISPIAEIQPGGWILPKGLGQKLEEIAEFKVYPDDTWVVTFPKCGTTWTQEMVWLLRNNLDYATAGSTLLPDRSPYLEMMGLLNLDKLAPTLDDIAKMPRPRCIKSHLPADLVPRQIWTVKPKVIFVARDPRDVVISFHHLAKAWEDYHGTFEEYVDAWLANRVLYGPFWPHVFSYWKRRNNGHVLFNTYEEMIRDLPGVIKKTAAFLNVDLSESELSKLADHLSFEKMKTNQSVNYDSGIALVRAATKVEGTDLKFMRSGKSGGWKSGLTADMIKRFAEWNKKELQGTEFEKYPWSDD